MREQLIEVRDRLTGPDSSIVAPSTIRSAYEAEGPDSIEELVKKAALFVLEHQAGIGGKMSEDKIESAREILSALEAYRDAHLEEKTSIRFVTSDHDILNFVEDSIRGLQRALSEQGAALQ